MIAKLLLALAALSPLMPAAAANTQSPVDQADPSVVEEELRDPKREAPKPGPKTPLLPEADASATSALTRPVEVRSISVEGATEVSAAAFEPAVRPFLNRRLDSRDLRALARAVADIVRAAGYGFATAWIPEQTIAGARLRVEIDEGRIDDVSASGDAAAPVEAMLAPLADGRPVRTAELERRLLLAGDLPGVSVGKPRLRRTNGRNLLVVDTKWDRTSGRASVDNWGSGTVGPVRAQLSVDLNGVFASNDRLAIGGVATPLQPREFGLVRLGYTKGVGTEGTEVSLSGYAARSRPGGVLRDRGFEGTSLEASIGVSHPFLRTRNASIWTDAEFSLRDSEQSRRDVRIRNDRLAVLKVGNYLFARLGDGRARARVTLSQGLGILGATREDDPLRSRVDGSGIFSKAEFWGDYDHQLSDSVSVQIQAEGQLASQPLLSSEEMGLGGRYFLRGYDYRELSGDKGIAGSIELRFDLPKLGRPIRAAQIYGYADAGTVGNLDGGRGGGSLASAGGGIRVWLEPRLEAGLEIGVPLSEGPERDERPDPRISFSLTARF